MVRLSHLLTLTPRETWRIARQRLPGFKGGPSWTVDELLSSAKHARGIRFAEHLLRHEAIVRQKVPAWVPLEFEGKRVVEVGCGPLGGYGPLAIFRGASSFESADPEWAPELFYSEPVIEKYLRIFHADLVALYGPRMPFCDFLEALRSRMRIVTCGFERAPIAAPVDIVLSQSVLEHVFPLAATVAKLAEIQGPATRFLHLVDFGNHYPTQNPFEGLYAGSAADYIRTRGRAINCLRISDVGGMFARAGIATVIAPSRVLDGTRGAIHDSWRSRYSDEDLFTQLALVASPA